MKNSLLILLFLCFLSAGAPLCAQDIAAASAPASASAPATASQPASQPAAAPAIPTADLFNQSDAVKSQLKDFEADESANPVVDEINDELPVLSQEIAARRQDTDRLLASNPSLETLSNEESYWDAFSETFSRWNHELAAHATTLDSRVGTLQGELAIWKQTLDSLSKADAANKADPAANPAIPARITAQAQETCDAVQAGLDQAGRARTTALSLEARVASLGDTAAEALDELREARDQATRQLFSRESPPVWEIASPAVPSGTRRSIPPWTSQFETLVDYFERAVDRFIFQAFILVFFTLGLYWARRRFKSWLAVEPTLAPAAPVFESPLAAAVVLSLMLSFWLHPQAPRLFWTFSAAVVVLPVVLLIRRLVDRALWPLLGALVVFFIVDQVHSFLLGFAPWPRVVFLGEMLVAVIFLARFSSRLHHQEPATQNRLRWAIAGCRLAILLFALAFVANSVGYGRLGFLIGGTVLRSVYLAVILYAAVAVADGLVILLLHLRLLGRLAAVRRHAAMLRDRARLVFVWATVLLWIYLLLRVLYISTPVLGALREFLFHPASIGGFQISLGQILSGVFTVWAAFAISRFIRFLLDEDVYPHVSLPRGLGSALSMIIHYAVLVVGFGIAIAFLGFPVSQFTILTGAFGVGLGFGLQTIINNFFSGIIVLAERPVRVGDIIEMDGIPGTITRIGIRATVYRVADGSEIILPNARLVSERVINWTLTDRDRGFEIPVTTDTTPDPRRVIAILEETARGCPGIAPSPAPAAQITGLTGGNFAFTLTASAQNIDTWKRVRSDLALAVQAALKKENIAIK